MLSPPELEVYARMKNSGVVLTPGHPLLREVWAKPPNATRCNLQALTTFQPATSFLAMNLSVENKRVHHGYYSTPLIHPRKYLLFWRKEKHGGLFPNTAAPNQVRENTGPAYVSCLTRRPCRLG